MGGCYQDYARENRDRFGQTGAIESLLDYCGPGGMYYKDVAGQFSCWCAFSSFHSRPNHLKFIKHGGLEIALAVYRDHGPQSYRVREDALQALNGVVCYNRTTRASLFRLG